MQTILVNNADLDQTAVFASWSSLICICKVCLKTFCRVSTVREKVKKKLSGNFAISQGILELSIKPGKSQGNLK